MEDFPYNCLLVSVSEATTTTGSPYLRGMIRPLDNPDTQIPFRWWGSSLENESHRALLQPNTPLIISGKLDSFKGQDQVIISQAGPDEQHSLSDYIKQDPAIAERNWGLVTNLMQSLLTPEAYQLLNDLMAPHLDRFREEFAGNHMHDASPGGLLWHSFKVTYHLSNVVKLSTHIKGHVNTDVLYLASFLHDFGKIWEYNLGAYTDRSWVTHRTFMVSYLTENRTRIEGILGEEGFWRLSAAIAQHHGPFEERPRIIEAALVHFADMLDAHATALDEKIPELAKGSAIKVQDFYLR